MSLEENILYQDASDSHHIKDTVNIHSHNKLNTTDSKNNTITDEINTENGNGITNNITAASTTDSLLDNSDDNEQDPDQDEADVVGRALTAIVDIGSNGIRFSISSKAPHHARIMPCVFKDRLGISLFDAQLPDSANSNQQAKKPIPQDAIQEIVQAMIRFKWICEDFGVPENGVRVVATEATREAANSKEFRDIIYQTTGWKVDLLSKEDEGRCGAYGVASSFHDISGLFMDLGGGSSQISWISANDGEVRISEYPVSLPYGAAALTHRLKFEDSREVYDEIKKAYELALEKINLPQSLIDEAEREGGFRLFVCGGGFRGLGHLILSQNPNYPIQTIINGYSIGFKQVKNMSNYLLLKNEIPKFNSNNINNNNEKEKIFRVSARREQQLPAVGLLVSAAFESLPKIKTVHFSEGGVREGVLYSMIPNSIKIEDPLLTATRPYAPLLSDNYWDLLKTGLPTIGVPDEVAHRVVPALCNIAFVHCSYPKELQPTAALHIATTGIISGSHGLSHKIRALIGIACCERWGADIPPIEESYYKKLEKLVLEADSDNGESLLYWTKYCGKMMYVICGIHPGGNIRPGSLLFKVRNSASATTTPGAISTTIGTANASANESADELEISVNNNLKNLNFTNPPIMAKSEVLVILPTDDVKYSYSVRSRIMTLQKKIKKLNKTYNGPEKVKVIVQYGNTNEV
ncbi:hypothetical protein B5S31_g510 [[Candida] boidinii]|nr:hypothetical protein B5S29_g1511 [[Candida] boidinii]OWB70829.1 hypothetical protein B5S31_g510 [[Candida] boidinii]OWB76718.1 hypothetical protein B5S32_g873 [[Candida] boidinii]